jgi:hypothetical protein
MGGCGKLNPGKFVGKIPVPAASWLLALAARAARMPA